MRSSTCSIKGVCMFLFAFLLACAFQLAVPQRGIAETGDLSLNVAAAPSFLRPLAGSVDAQGANASAVVKIKALVQGDGHQGWRATGAGKASRARVGTVGESLRLEKFWVKLGSTAMGSVKYKAYVGKRGWSSWKADGEPAGAKGKRIEALKLRLTGDIAEEYDVYYRVHVQDIGWQPWVATGGKAGLAGKGKRVEALDVKLVKKGKVKALKDGAYVITSAKNSRYGLAVNGAKVKRASFSASMESGKFYVRNELGGITLQSVSNGKFLTAVSSGVKLKPWSGTSRQVWELTSNGGLRLESKTTGLLLRLSGPQATVSAKGTGFTFTSAALISEGTYRLKGVARGNALNVEGASLDCGANVNVAGVTDGGEQAFSFWKKKGGLFKIKNARSGMALDVEDGSTENGANVRQWETSGVDAQKWKPCIERDGSFYFVNEASGKALTVAGKGKDGGNVSSRTYTGKKTQRWELEPFSWAAPESASLTGDGELDEFVEGVAAENDYDLWSCFDWMSGLRHVQSVDERTHYGIMDDDTLNSYATHAMQEGVADCYVDAATFCWLARACGYVANMRAGGCPSARGGVVPHGWTEVYIDGTTYVCDANLRRDLPGYNWYLITYSSSPVTYSL